MSDVIDNLFSVIPIVLAILWVMRRVSRKKTGEKTSKPGRPAGPVPPAGQENGRSGLSKRLQSIEEKASRTVRGIRDDILGTVPENKSPGEDDLYQKMETRRVEPADRTGPGEKPHRPSPAAAPIARLVEKRDDKADEPGYAGTEKSNSFDRFRKLSPLAQGIVWSIILDKPPALKEPEN